MTKMMEKPPPEKRYASNDSLPGFSGRVHRGLGGEHHGGSSFIRRAFIRVACGWEASLRSPAAASDGELSFRRHPDTVSSSPALPVSIDLQFADTRRSTAHLCIVALFLHILSVVKTIREQIHTYQNI